MVHSLRPGNTAFVPSRNNGDGRMPTMDMTNTEGSCLYNTQYTYYIHFAWLNCPAVEHMLQPTKRDAESTSAALSLSLSFSLSFSLSLSLSLFAMPYYVRKKNSMLSTARTIWQSVRSFTHFYPFKKFGTSCVNFICINMHSEESKIISMIRNINSPYLNCEFWTWYVCAWCLVMRPI